MAATAEGTARFADDADLAEVGFGALGRTGLTVSRLGFGTYRVDDRAPEHREAMITALQAGVNLIDTASNYGDGHAERLTGSVLQELLGAGKIEREGVVVVTKGGYAQGEALESVQAAVQRGDPFPEMEEVSEGVWHGLHPRFLEEQLARSLSRLQLATVDVYLLHNPEHLLASRGSEPGADLPALRAELDRRLEAAFGALEAAADAGRIGWYGVSSNGLGSDPGSPGHVSVARLLELAGRAARARGRTEPRFAVVELPLNALETHAAVARDAAGQT
jgi:aryl-alcohol dehydrogenase-like predicted oxidoreductase